MYNPASRAPPKKKINQNQAINIYNTTSYGYKNGQGQYRNRGFEEAFHNQKVDNQDQSRLSRNDNVIGNKSISLPKIEMFAGP